MIRLPHVAPLLVTLSLLAQAAPAYPECAWVLWHGQLRDDGAS
jgi:hypothetical protein